MHTNQGNTIQPSFRVEVVILMKSGTHPQGELLRLSPEQQKVEVRIRFERRDEAYVRA